MVQTVLHCPSCGVAIEVAEALAQQVVKDVEKDLLVKHKHDIEQAKQEASQTALKEVQAGYAQELADLKKQISEKDAKVTELRSQEVALREAKRKLEDREKEMELEIARKLDEARRNAEDEILKKTQESFRLKELEKEKVIQDLRRALEDAQRKAQQGSQQTQGEVAELDFEQSLRGAFPSDLITPVEKGIKGADIRQVVRTSIGNTCGVILWESKRTKSWSNEWISKLKGDLRAEKANIPVIVSTVLPDAAANGFGFIDGVYVVSIQLYLPIAAVLREKLIEIAREKFIIQNKEGSAEKLYEYVTSHEFRQRIEAIAEVYTDMNMQILKEKAAFERIWKAREAQVQKLMNSTGGIVGAMSGLIGQSFPSIKGLELLEEENDTEQGRLL